MGWTRHTPKDQFPGVTQSPKSDRFDEGALQSEGGLQREEELGDIKRRRSNRT